MSNPYFYSNVDFISRMQNHSAVICGREELPLRERILIAERVRFELPGTRRFFRASGRDKRMMKSQQHVLDLRRFL